MLRKGVCPYEHMDDWKKFNEILFSEKRCFYSHLNMEDITNEDYKHSKRLCKDFEIKNSGENHDFCVQSNILLLADMFDNFGNMCFKIYERDPALFLTATELTWQAVLKRLKPN